MPEPFPGKDGTCPRVLELVFDLQVGMSSNSKNNKASSVKHLPGEAKRGFKCGGVWLWRTPAGGLGPIPFS